MSTTHTTVTQILDQMSVIALDCSIWSGARRLKPEDLVLGKGGQLPSDEVVSLGSKKLCKREVLKPFHRLRDQACRLCAREGVRFLGGYAVPDHSISGLSLKLDQVQQDFNQEKQTFLTRYDQHIQEWVNAHPDFAEAIRNAVPDVQHVGQRFQFGYTTYKVVASPQPDNLNQQVNQLGSALREEISRDAQTLFEQTFRGKEKVTRKALNPILRLRDKLHGLAFVDPGIAPIVQRLDAGLAQLPNSGALEGEVLTQLMERVLLLCSVEQMERCAEGLTAIDYPRREPVKMQEPLEVDQLPEVNDTGSQKEPVIEEPVVVPEETNTTATFYF
ncbi:DUF3150 domain-containing protein [Endozoicomonas gorgoniicola]|uniref:DUF3150 domain-containing protein n=1 Tax=Endozoicomonas gorgoniicola TaxID=1234144 RepID=A0ABT3MTZ0_9GAMM|nr:DUF3150 domain-containing protein [Endozoicomonas gorgoniicola]MCW7552851.1 DUF3150 domain-containing protein [Endozoicomonas gorgoniicola]